MTISVSVTFAKIDDKNRWQKGVSKYLISEYRLALNCSAHTHTEFSCSILLHLRLGSFRCFYVFIVLCLMFIVLHILRIYSTSVHTFDRQVAHSTNFVKNARFSTFFGPVWRRVWLQPRF